MIEYREAVHQDLKSLATIFPRSFHKVNPFMKQLIPDTPAVRAWWTRIFEADIDNPTCHVLIAFDEHTSEVVGSIQLRGMKRGSHFGGLMAEHSITEDHDAETWSTATKVFAANEERIVGDRDRYLIEVMCVDHEYQGKGIGRRLVSLACEAADQTGLPIYLETSQASGFYTRLDLGFDIVDSKTEEGVHRNAILLRQSAVLK